MNTLPIEIYGEIFKYINFKNVIKLIYLNKEYNKLEIKYKNEIFYKNWTWLIVKKSVFEIIEKVIDTNKIKFFEYIKTLLSKQDLIYIFEEFCSYNYNKKCILFLIDNNHIDPSINDNHAIRLAAFSGKNKIVKILLKDKRVDSSCCSNKIFKHVCERGYYKVLKLLILDNKIHFSKYNIGFLNAIYNNCELIIKLLINDYRVDPSINNNAAIKIASQNGSEKIVKILLKDERVDPSINNNEIIKYAKRNGLNNIVEILLTDPRVNLDKY